MKKYKYEIILLVVDAICMILELVASRLLSPYFGNSNIVWTSVIGIILLSGSIGNYFGGIIADTDNTEKKLKEILIFSAIAILIIPIMQKNILTDISNLIPNIKIAAILATIFLFFIPSLLMGLMSPIILKLKLQTLETAGKTSGTINAIATIGGITGTFLGGFFLIPHFGSVQILYILCIILLFLIPIVDFKFSLKSTIVIIFITVISLTMLFIYDNNNISNSEKVLSGLKNIYVSYDTEYGRVLIYNIERDGEPIRMLNIDSGFESATYISENKINELVFNYTKFYDLMFKGNIEIQNTLLIGGAGYSYPKYFISHYKDKNMDVVEIDPKITEIAKKYFYLDKLIEDYNLEENNRLNLITEDGRTYLNSNTKKYDAILNDAFSGSSPAKTLTTLEAAQKIKASLTENGLYLTNVISSFEGKSSQFLKAELNTLKQVFKNTYVIPCDTVNNLEKPFNIMVIATDDTLYFEENHPINLDESEIILTDNFCPIDTLIPQK